jgi:hypothetical protein
MDAGSGETRFQFQSGDEAITSDEHKLGKVVATDNRFVTVEHGLLGKTRYLVPFHAINSRTDGKIYLKVTKSQADDGDWGPIPASRPVSPPVGSPSASSASSTWTTAAPVAPTQPAQPQSTWSTSSPPAPTVPSQAAKPSAPPAAPAPASATWVPPAVEPSVNDLRPMLPAGVENEPMLLLDTTGSMTYPVAERSAIQRREVIGEAIGRIVEKLAAQDSQAAKEQEAGEDAGGLMTVTFAGGSAECIDDLSPDNWREKWAAIQWGGGTRIMPGWNLLVDTYMEEFGEVPKQDRPHLLALIVTDGEADDTDQFAQTLAQAKGGTYVCVAILGFGTEHDRALAAYQRIAAVNDHVRVVTFGSETDPTTIADGVLSLLGQGTSL